MTWARPVGIGFLVLGVLFAIGVRVEVDKDPTPWLLTVVLVVLGVIAGVIGAGLIAVGNRRS